MRYLTSLKTRLLCLMLVICLVSMTACQPGTKQPDNTTAAPTSEATKVPETEAPTEPGPTPEELAAAEQERFSTFTRNEFLEAVLENTVNLHYTIADPEAFGIEEYAISLGTYEEWTEEDILNDLDEMATELMTYDYDLLTDEQKMTYDILKHYIDTEEEAASLYLYSEPLGPTTGAATQLSITFAEYSFYREQDIKDYLQLLPLIQGYFESIIAFEQKRADAGLFMTEATLEANLESCASFVENPDKNFLITSFASRMEKIDWLDDQAKADYTAQNTDLVLNSVIPAYNSLASSLESMRSLCTEDGGLARLPEGQKYFEYLMESRLGSGRTVTEMTELVEDYQQKQLNSMYTLLNIDAELANSFSKFKFTFTDPEKILNYLSGKIAEDYPAIPDNTYTIHYVEKELEDVLSPAFYMIPPMDRYLENTIYINNGSVDESTLFTTLAHEGYPGHLFQNVYFNSVNSEPLRAMLSYLGYSEGWATYVENESYFYDPKINRNVAKIFSLNNSVTLSVYAVLDICINYSGWDREDTADYVSQFFGSQPENVINEIYDAISGDPCYYLSYHGGYLEMMEMREIAEATLGDKFNLKEFHTFVLNLGECPFSLANQRLADWLEAQE